MARTSRARIRFDGSSRSAGSDDEAAGTGCAVKSAKVEYCAKGKGAGNFQKWPTISRNGVLPKRRGCRLFPKMADYFFCSDSGLALLFLRAVNSTPFEIIQCYTYVKNGGETVCPLAPPIVSGPRCQTGSSLRRRRLAPGRQKDLVGS